MKNPLSEARAIKAADASLVMFGLPNSPMIAAAKAAGLQAAAEGFADRAYQPDGSLTPRSRELIAEKNTRRAPILKMAQSFQKSESWIAVTAIDSSAMENACSR